MAELKKHEVIVENSSGEKKTVSAEYYKNNKERLKMIDDNGWSNKMDQVETKNKAAKARTPAAKATKPAPAEKPSE